MASRSKLYPVLLRKRIRGLIKDCLPYMLQRRRAARVYGLYYPDLSTSPGGRGYLQSLFFGCLPFGLVRCLKGLPRDGAEAELMLQSGPRWRWQFAPHYPFPRGKRRRLLRDRADGLRLDRELIGRNQACSILVILHLFYDTSWRVIREYLANLACYRADLIVTVTEGCISEKTLADIRMRYPSVQIVTCENRGFDVWPFIKALSLVDLKRYDVVFKLHSKGVTRPNIFIYDQIFKYSDWFYNLFDGVLGGRSVHRVVDMLMHDGVKLTAAENLIVHDPRHKESMVRNFCARRQLAFRENYSFVAGTCFAVRSEVLEPLQALALTEEDFPPTVRGVFSLAHVLERWMCFAAGDAIRGIPVPHNTYDRELAERRALSPLRMLEDSRFILDDEFFYLELEMNIVRGYEVIRMKLKDIRRRKPDGTICPLSECEPFLYLCGDEEGYREYCINNRAVSGYDMSKEKFDALQESMARHFDPKRMPVVQGPDYIIRDGQHRCCILLKKYGPEHEIDAVHFW